MSLSAPDKTRGACNGMAVPDSMIIKHISYCALVWSYRVNRLAHPAVGMIKLRQQWYRRVHIRYGNYRKLHYPPCFNGRKNNTSFNVYIIIFVRSQNCEMRLLASGVSVRPHGTIRLPLDGFSWNLTWASYALDRASSWYLNKGRPAWWHLLYYVNVLLNMFRKMDVLTSETCWAVNWHNKASVIKLVCLYSNDMSIFRKSFKNIQVSLHSDKNNGYCTWRQI